MKKLMIKILVNSLALVIVSNTIAGIKFDSIFTLVFASFLLGLVNSFLRPLLIILTLPFNIMSLGLFTLVINAFLLLLVSGLVSGFTIISFWHAFWAALFFSIVSFILNIFITPIAQDSKNFNNCSRHRKLDNDFIDIEAKIKDEDC